MAYTIPVLNRLSKYVFEDECRAVERKEESLIRIAHLRYALARHIFKILVSLENGHHQAVWR